MERALLQLRHAVRSLLRSPSFTLPAVGILALTLGAATAIFAVVDAVVLRPLPLPASDRLVALCEDHPSLAGACVVSPPDLEDLRGATRTLSAAGLGRSWAFLMDTGAGTRRGVAGGIATPSLFTTLGVRPELGRLFTADEVGPGRDGEALLSHALWTTAFGADSAVVGRTVDMDGQPVTIVGVLPAGFQVPRLEWVELWRPLHIDPRNEENRSWRGFDAYGRLAEGESLDQARVELEGLYQALGEEHAEVTPEWQLRVRPLLHVVLGDTRPALFVFLGAVALLLLIGCANVVNLLLARGIRRRHDLAVRAALGAGRGRLAAGVAVESGLLALAGGGIGALLSVGLVRLFVALAPPGVPRLAEAGVGFHALGFALLLSVAAALLFGLVPALRTGREGDVGDRLRALRGGEGRRAGRLRSTLVVAELSLSLVLLASAGFLARSFQGFLAWRPGFDPSGILVVPALVPPGRYHNQDLPGLFRRTEEAVAAVPGVRSVGMTSSGPLFGGRETFRMAPAGAPTGDLDALPTVRWFDVSPGYRATLGVPLLEGRWIEEGDLPGTPQVAVLNETAARSLWPGQDPVGREVVVPERDVTVTVVGVVKDVPPLTPGTATEPELYWSNRQFGRYYPYWVVRVDGDPLAAAPGVKAALHSVEPDLDVGPFRTLDDYVGGALVRPRFNLLLLGAFAATALALAVVGLYAVMSFLVGQRMREMGIRVALGATRSAIVRRVLAEGSGLVALGVVLGLAGTAAASGLLARVVFGVAPTDALTLGATAALLALVALGATLGPALRASRADPRALLEDA